MESIFNNGGVIGKRRVYVAAVPDSPPVPEEVSGFILKLDPANYSGSGNTLPDTSGNGFDATLNNSPTWNNDYFTYNGSNQTAQVADNPSISGGDGKEFSFIIWFRSGNFTGTSNRLVHKQWDVLDGDYGLDIFDTGELSYYSESSPGVPDYRLTAGSVSNNEWYMAAVTFDGINDELVIYLNGNEIARDSSTGNISADTPGNLYFGALLYDNTFPPQGDYYTGDIGLYKYWDSVLTQSEVQTEYTANVSRYSN